MSALADSSIASVSAKVIGWMIIAGSCVVRVPQILRILRAKSVEGISATGFIVETLCTCIILGYNLNNGYVFSSYGDVFACWLQNLVICVLMLRYAKPPVGPLIWVGSLASFAAFNYWIISGACGMQVLLMLQVGVGFAMSLGAKVPQVWLNYKRGNSGELSLTTSALSAAGNFARLFTTVILTADVVLFLSTFAQWALNTILTWQCWQTDKQQKIELENKAA